MYKLIESATKVVNAVEIANEEEGSQSNVRIYCTNR